ncbi:MAG: hypothetical protein ACYSWQ_11355 [Planctomycetota bacterium]|jgi:hypothetical protein
MAKAKRLSRKQLALIDDLFASELDEQKILDKHKVARHLYRKWVADGQFDDELNHRVADGYRRSTLLLASNARKAAKKLVELAGGDKGETTRKACLDIITMDPSIGLPGTPATADDKAEEPSPISPQTASRLLAVLAGGEGQQ